MPYSRISDLPPRIQRLPEHAQEIFLQAFNHAWEEYASPLKRRLPASREETAMRVAWGAVKRVYVKSPSGWVRRKK